MLSWPPDVADAIVLAAAVAGGVVAGVAVRRWLVEGSWRRPGEEGARLPPPWEPTALAVLFPLVLGLSPSGAWPGHLLLAVIGVALASVDLAVHRLPDVLTLGGGAAVLALLLTASVLLPGHPGWEPMLWSIALATPVLLLLGLAGLGLGDVKLGVLLAGALGWCGVPVAAATLMAGFVLGGLWAGVLLMTRRARAGTAFAYGPWMLLGAVAGLLVAPG